MNKHVLVLGACTFAACAPLMAAKWTTVGNLDVARWSATATLLPDGRVLVTGGRDATMTASNSGTFDVATFYDVTRGTFAAAPPMVRRRDMHTSAVLTNAKTLLLEGDGTYQLADTAEVYDAGTGTFASVSGTGGNTGNYSQGTSTRLADGRILMFGGHKGEDGTNAGTACVDCDHPVNLSSRVAVSNTTVSSWTTVTNSVQRSSHTATLLPNNKVLIAGGLSGGYAVTSSTQLFDPVTDTLSSAAAMSVARRWHTATLLHDGRVFVAGGFTGPFTTKSTALYTPATNTWAAGPNLTTSRGRHTAVLMPNGVVALIGGRNVELFSSSYLSSVEIYNPATNTLSGGRPCPSAATAT